MTEKRKDTRLRARPILDQAKGLTNTHQIIDRVMVDLRTAGCKLPEPLRTEWMGLLDNLSACHTLKMVDRVIAEIHEWAERRGVDLEARDAL